MLKIGEVEGAWVCLCCIKLAVVNPQHYPRNQVSPYGAVKAHRLREGGVRV